MPRSRVCIGFYGPTRGDRRYLSRIGDDPTVGLGRFKAMRTQTSVLISEPTKMYCDLLRKAFYSVRQRFQVVAYSASAGEILAALQEYRPQVAVINSDLEDGALTGIRLLSVIRKNYPDTRTLLVIGSPDPKLMVDAFRLGADGVFNRNRPFEHLCKAVEAISRGQIWANAEELHHVLNAFARSPKPQELDSTVESRLTKRETAVVRLAIEGLSNREIAKQLTLTEHTVKNYLFRVFDKLGVSNRVELVLFCLRQEEEAREEFSEEKEMAPSPRKVFAVPKQKAVGR
jgi:two-component system nitrate/nitrite response regulator NarL